jgi:hypothetical protein
MGIEHLMEILNKPTDRGFLAYAHTTRVAAPYQHWPKEAYTADHAKLPTIRILSYIQHIPEAELDQIPNLQAPNQIAMSMRATTREVDGNRAERLEHIPTSLHPKDYARKIQNQCKKLNYFDRLLKRLAPLCEEGVKDWTLQLEKDTQHLKDTPIYTY